MQSCIYMPIEKAGGNSTKNKWENSGEQKYKLILFIYFFDKIILKSIT